MRYGPDQGTRSPSRTTAYLVGPIPVVAPVEGAIPKKSFELTGFRVATTAAESANGSRSHRLGERMNAPLRPVLPPREHLRLCQPPRHEPESRRRRELIEVESSPDVVAVGDEHLEPQVEVAPLLADEPRLPAQSPSQVPRHGLGVVDREERVGDRSSELAA